VQGEWRRGRAATHGPSH